MIIFDFHLTNRIVKWFVKTAVEKRQRGRRTRENMKITKLSTGAETGGITSKDQQRPVNPGPFGKSRNALVNRRSARVPCRFQRECVSKSEKNFEK